MNSVNEQAKEFLILSKELIKNENSWTKKKTQVNAKGEWVDKTSPHAIAFCAIGATSRIRVLNKIESSIASFAGYVLNEIAVSYVTNTFSLEELREYFPAILKNGFTNIIAINDSPIITHNNMMEIFDMTIRAFEDKKFYTDYTFIELGDKEGEIAPIREIKPIFFDGDKYMTIEVSGIETSIKYNYIYMEPKRVGQTRSMWASEAMVFSR